MEDKNGGTWKENEYMLRKSTFEMFLLSVCIIASASALISTIEKNGGRLISLYLILAVSVFITNRIVKKAEKYMAPMVCVMIGIQFIFLPLAFYLEGGMLGPIPIWAAVNLIFVFLLFEWNIVFLFFLGTVTQYSFLLSRMYRNPVYGGIPGSRMEVFFDCLLFFLAAAVWMMSVIIVQEKSLRAEKVRTEKNNEMIDAAGKEKCLILTDISKDISAPVNSIIGMTELILKEEEDNTIRKEVVHIKEASYDLLDVVGDALIYSRLELENAELFPVSYKPYDLLEGIVDSVSDDIHNKNLYFMVKIAPDIPRVLHGDYRRIRQVFMHLLQAAVSSTAEGRILMSVDYKREEPGGITLLCNISDTGRGIELSGEDLLTGIRLKFAVCREYLKLMQGRFSVKNLEEVGRAVSFTIENEIINDQPMIRLKEPATTKVLICVVNDMERYSWQNIMIPLGIKAVYVHNRHGFEKAVQGSKYDYIFMGCPEYEKLNSIIAYYHCEKDTYVVGDNKNIFGDFGKCKILRIPISCFNVAEVLSGKWQEEDYMFAHDQGSFTVRNSRVLVIDDNFVNIKIATGIFAKYGVDINIAASGEEALKKIEKERYDLILTDVIMPGMGGEEVLHEIRKKSGEYYQVVPIIAVTSDSGDEVREKLLKKGFQEYLLKPIRIKSIEECMLKFLPEHNIIRKEHKPASDTRKEEFIQEERGLNTNKGISNIGFNKEAYWAILNTYYLENCKKIMALPDIFKKEELSAFISAAHGVKSTSASIGAMGLSSLARELEYAGKDGDVGFISEKLPLFLKEYQLILDEIKAYLEENGGLAPGEKEPQFAGTEEEALALGILKELKAKMDRMDLKACTDIFERLSATNYGQKDNGEISRVKEAYGRFDFHAAKTALNSLMERKQQETAGTE